MNFIDKICGRKSTKEKKPSTEEAITKLREMERLLETKQQFLENKIENELKMARNNGKTNKRLALHALKRKRRYEQQLQQIDGTLATIEMQREALEGAHTNTTVLKSMKYAADALKTAHQTINADKVHDMMDDIAEQQELSKEITDAISNPTAFNSYSIDEDELEKELEELNQQLLDKELLEAESSPLDLPPVPKEALPQRPNPNQKTQEEEELEKLMHWAV